MNDKHKTDDPKLPHSLTPDQQAAEADLDRTGRVRTYLKLADAALATDPSDAESADASLPEEPPLSKTG